jgi:hypothetical protein
MRGQWGPGAADAVTDHTKAMRSRLGAMATPPDPHRYPHGAPLVVGTPDGSPPRLVIQNFYGFGNRLGDEVWVTGAGVDDRIARSDFTPISRVTIDVQEGDTLESIAARLMAAEHQASLDH